MSERGWKPSMEGLISKLIFCTILFFYTQLSDAADTLRSTESLSDGQTLISSGQVYELGFFSPGNKRNRYLGIWYRSSPLTVAWVANRNDPITDLSGSLNISKDNNLVLVDKSGGIFWSSNLTAAAQSPIAQILDTGNLVLREAGDTNSENFLWQSFDHPTDTLLPGMKLGWDLKTGLNRILTSWKSTDDPSVGDYSCQMELKGLPQIVIRKGGAEVYRTGEWYGNRFSSRHTLSENTIHKPMFVNNSDEVYYTIGLVDPAIFMRFQLDTNGYVEGFLWQDSRQWALLFTMQWDYCDIYNVCGSNGICDIGSSHDCACLTGFVPKSPKDWDAFISKDGCLRDSPLDCQKGEGFIKYGNVKLPDVVNLRENLSISDMDCESHCLENCNCTAYAHSNSTGNGQGCLFWYGDLVDIRCALLDFGQDLYIRLSATEIELIADSRKRRRVVKVIVAVLLPSLLLLTTLISLCMLLRKRRKVCAKGDQIFSKQRFNTTGSDEKGTELTPFDLATVKAATDNFSSENKIGEGGFGPVYKGVLQTGQEIAVKRLSHKSRQGLKELKNEVILISKLQHRNLVRLLGCCIEGEEMMLIYEYMANRSLDTYIFDKTRSKDLGWSLRLKIIVGIARGLLYLHQDSRLRIIHRDLKLSNILLDNEMEPKISDFGLARMFSGDQLEARTKTVMGTYGYMSPEYAVDGYFSIKSDVFSFGVLVLEVISGEKNSRFLHPEHDFSLLGHAWKLWGEGRGLELLDSSMGDQFSRDEALRCIHIGLLCVQQRPKDRPTMLSVVMMLQNENKVLPDEPKPPGMV